MITDRLDQHDSCNGLRQKALLHHDMLGYLSSVAWICHLSHLFCLHVYNQVYTLSKAAVDLTCRKGVPDRSTDRDRIQTKRIKESERGLYQLVRSEP